MPFEATYLILAIFVFGMNIIPALMPPTWVVLAFFYTQFHLSLLPTVLIGATAATLGRVILSLLARDILRPFIPKKFLHNYDDLGMFLSRYQRLTIPLVLTYAFFPVSSNQLFIIAGLSRLNIGLIAGSFFVGRLISYSFWVNLASHVTKHLSDIFIRHFSTGAIVAEVGGFIFVIIVGMINWRKLLHLGKLKEKLKP